MPSSTVATAVDRATIDDTNRSDSFTHQTTVWTVIANNERFPCRLHSGPEGSEELNQAFFFCQDMDLWMSHCSDTGQLDVLRASITFDKISWSKMCLKKQTAAFRPALHPVNPFNTIRALYKTFIHFLEKAQSVATVPLWQPLFARCTKTTKKSTCDIAL